MTNKILNQLFSSCKKWKTLVLIGMLLTLGVGQMWGMTFGASTIYFDNTNANFTNPCLYIWSGEYNETWQMTKVSGSDCYWTYTRSSAFNGDGFLFKDKNTWTGQSSNITDSYNSSWWTNCYSKELGWKIVGPKSMSKSNTTETEAGNGTSGSKYIVKEGTKITVSASGTKIDANHTVEYKFNNSSWSTTNTYTVVNSAVAATDYSVTVYVRTKRGDLTSREFNLGTIYYKGETKYNVKAVASPVAGGSVTPTSNTAMGQYTGGTITASENTGYTFTGWTGGTGTYADASEETTTFKPTAASTVTANFSENMSTVTLTASPSSKGTFTVGSTPNQTSTTAGVTTTREVTAVPIAGYSFTGWSITGGASISSLTDNPTTVTGDGTGTAATLTATFEEDLTYYDVTFGVGTSYTSFGSISAKNNTTSSAISSGDDVLSASNITFTASPNTGYEVEGWYTNAACTAGKHDAGSTTYTIASLSSDVTVYVKFIKTTYNITYTSAGNWTYGGSNPTTGQYEDSKSFTVTPNTGYTVSVTSSDASLSQSGTTYSFTMPATDVAINVSATETKSTITVTTATTSWGSLKFGSTTKSWGATASLGVATTQSITATAASGYKFVRWDLTGAAASASSLTSSTIILKADGSGSTGTATAVFEEDLSSPWIVAGGNKIVTTGTTWRTTADANNTMFKKTGHSTESVVYFTVPVTTICSGDNNGNFQFKIYNTSTSTWYSLGADGSSYYLLKAEDGKAKSLVTDGKNIELRAYVTGNYEFKLDYSTSTPKLTVTWPVFNQIRFYSARTGGTGTDTYDFNTASTPWTKTVSLTAGSTYWFKVVENSEFFGNTGTMTRTNSSKWTMSNVTENCGITPDFDGDYTFSYNPTTNSLSVTYPTAYSVTYDGNGKTSGDVPAVSYHIPASDVTLANNSGYLYKEGYAFNGWNTAAEGGGTHYDAKGTLTAINANKTLYAEWVANDYTMYFFNKDSWSSVYAYMWDVNNDPEKPWHGRAMTSYQENVYKIDYNHDVQKKVNFNNNASSQIDNLTIADGQTGDNWFYNDADKDVTTGGIHHGWSQYILVANFPTSTVAAVVGEKVTVVPTVVWADGINFADINITSTRASGSEKINAVVSGTNIIVSGSEAGTATFNITYTYSTHTEATITKTLTVKVMNGLTIQAKIPSDDNHWVYSNIVKMHYWGGAGTNANPSFEGDVTMSWIKDGADGKYYQACVPVSTEATPKTNFIFFYDNFNDAWRQTQNITNVTANSCYTIKHDAGLDKQRNAVKEGTGLCNDSWNIQITMGSGDIYTSNIVETSDEIVSFFAPSVSESKSYRQGVVTIEHNGTSVATVPASTFATSGVYTAKIDMTNPASPSLTNVALYDGNYYIRTDGAAGGWNNYKTNPANLMTEFTRNTNFPNESFSYYWVANVAKNETKNIKGTVANDYNPVLCNITADEYANEADGINLRFGYEPTTNEIVRGIVGGSTTNHFLNVVCATGSQIYKEIDCVTLLDDARYTSNPNDSKFADKSNWVYEIIVYAKIDDTHKTADVVLKSFYKGIHYLLGMEKDELGHETSNPVSFPVIKTGTTPGVYGLRVVYDFKTNRLFAAWAPADRVIDGVLDVDADVMFLRHEDGNAAQISFKTNESRIEDIKQAIFALELDNEKADHGGSGNIERHYFISLPFDCKVSNIFGIGGFMNYWGIQRYRGDLRAQNGWFIETPTFWEWMSPDDVMKAGEGYLLSVDKKALENNNVWKDGIIYQTRDTVLDPVTHKPIKTADGLSDSVVWVTHDDGSMLTMYFPSTTSGFTITPATGDALTITYPDQPCSITRDDRDKKDSNWKCIGTPGYKNITIDDYTQASPELVVNAAPRFLYEFTEQTSGAQWAKGTYSVTDGRAFTYKSFNSYMVQFAGTIDWAQYSKGDVQPSSIAARHRQTSETKATKVEIELLSSDNDALDRTFVWLQENATTGFDQNYDLNKMIEKKANQIYSLAEKDVPFAANVLPLGTDTVPLVINIANNGEYTFKLNVDKHVGMAPVLYDMYQSEKINLLSSDYLVELEKGNYEGRFFLLFQAEAPVVTSFENTNDGGQNVHSSEAIYDVLGRRVSTIYPGHFYIVNGEKCIAK